MLNAQTVQVVTGALAREVTREMELTAHVSTGALYAQK